MCLYQQFRVRYNYRVIYTYDELPNISIYYITILARENGMEKEQLFLGFEVRRTYKKTKVILSIAYPKRLLLYP